MDPLQIQRDSHEVLFILMFFSVKVLGLDILSFKEIEYNQINLDF